MSNAARAARRAAARQGRRCPNCRAPLDAVRSTKRFCSELCRLQAHRARRKVSAHQRKIREQLAATDPRPIAPNLSGYSVEIIDRAAAQPLVWKYEWLGTMGQATTFVGLFSPARELQDVVCFGHGPTNGIRKRIGSPALCLERGACVHFAPKNAASFLFSHACRLVYKATGTARFYAYADPMAGEYGAVYQAAGWAYLGQGIHGPTTRTHRTAVLPPGADPNVAANWQTTRALRRNGTRLTMAAALAAGWRIGTRAAKHVYAVHVGRDRRAWRRSLLVLPYPAPQPALKRRASASVAAGPPEHGSACVVS